MPLLLNLTLSCIMLKNGQTYFKNLAGVVDPPLNFLVMETILMKWKIVIF